MEIHFGFLSVKFPSPLTFPVPSNPDASYIHRWLKIQELAKVFPSLALGLLKSQMFVLKDYIYNLVGIRQHIGFHRFSLDTHSLYPGPTLQLPWLSDEPLNLNLFDCVNSLDESFFLTKNGLNWGRELKVCVHALAHIHSQPYVNTYKRSKYLTTAHKTTGCPVFHKVVLFAKLCSL